MKVIVTGATGHLGSEMVREFTAVHEVVAPTRAALDVTDAAAVNAAVAASGPDAVINCTAYNDVDGAEDNPATAFHVNAFAVQALARAAASAGAAFVHFSTDFVFDGEADRPYTEEDRPGPRSVYAASKLVGEWLARDAPRHYVLRVESLFGGRSAHALRSVGKIVEALSRGQEVPVFTDRVVSPTNVSEAAAATRHLLESGATAGLYHCVNSGFCRWDELAREAARLLGVEPRLKPVTLETVTLKAARPRFSALSNEKLLRAGARMSHWREALEAYIRLKSTTT